ncbi:MAG: hypothetical protein ACLTDR_11020 [Adlercreutzia equolifaciens]
MEATRDDIEGLFELQRIDLEISATTELDELPQRGIIVAARDKKAAIEAKSEQVAELKRATTKKITRIDDEDASLWRVARRGRRQAAVSTPLTVTSATWRPAPGAGGHRAPRRSPHHIAEDRAGVAAGGPRSAPWRPRSRSPWRRSRQGQEAIDSFRSRGRQTRHRQAGGGPAARWRRRSPRRSRIQPHGGSLRCGHRRARRQPLRRLPHGHRPRPSHRSCATRHRWVCAPRASVCW